MRRARGVRGSPWLLLASICCTAGCIVADDDDDDEKDADTPPVTAEPDAGASDGGRPDGGRDGGDTPKPTTCTGLVKDESCDKSKRPIVFIHGTVANGESFAHPALLFASNGYCPDRIRAIEYNSIPAAPCGAGDGGVRDGGAPALGGMDGGVPSASDGGSADASCTFVLDREAAYRQVEREVDQAIAKLLAETGADKVDLAGHSQGAGHGARYAGSHPDKVAHYLSLAGGDLAADPGGVPTLCLSSTGDRKASCGTTSNVVFDDLTLDHAAVSSSTEAFVEMYKFLNDGREPRYTTVQCGSPITLEGRALTFGDNRPLPGAKVEVYALNDAPRARIEPVAVLSLAADGSFAPFEVKPDVYYEFKLVPPPGDTRKPRRAYMLPFKRSDRLLRFNFESSDARASATGARVNYDSGHAVIVARRRQKAFMHPRDTLKIDGFNVVSAQNTLTATMRSKVTCALYLYDKSLTPVSGPGDRKSSGESIITGTFVDSADVFMPAMTPAFIEVDFNGDKLRIPNWPSTTEGMSLVLVD